MRCDSFFSCACAEPAVLRSSSARRFFVAITVRSVKGGAVKVWSSNVPAHDSQEELIDRAGYTPFAEGSWVEKGSYDAVGRYAITTEKAYRIACERLAVPGETEFVGKTVRWYYAKDVPGELVYALSGNKVPRSDGAMPCMAFNDNMVVPQDVDHDWYLLVDLASSAQGHWLHEVMAQVVEHADVLRQKYLIDKPLAHESGYIVSTDRLGLVVEIADVVDLHVDALFGNGQKMMHAPPVAEMTDDHAGQIGPELS